MRILVTHAGYKHTLAVVRALGKLGHEVDVIGHKRLNLSFFSRFCRKKYVLPTEKAAYTEGVCRILEDTSYDCLVPIGFPQLAWLAEIGPILESKVGLVLAPAATIALLEDKKATHALAKACGIPVPYTVFSTAIGSDEALLRPFTYPIVIKTLKESAEKAIFFPKNEVEAHIALSQCRAQNAPFLISETLSGHGIGYFALFDRGVCVQDFIHQRLREYPRQGGASCCAQSIDNETIRKYGRRILEAVEWHGIAMVEFRTDAHGQPFLLEVNPKFWGSFDLSVAAGVPFLEKYLCMATGAAYNRQQQPYTEGVVFSWPFQGDALHLIEARQWSALRHLFFSKKIETNLVWNDILASIFMVLQNLPALFKALKRSIFH